MKFEHDILAHIHAVNMSCVWPFAALNKHYVKWYKMFFQMNIVVRCWKGVIVPCKDVQNFLKSLLLGLANWKM
jgi:hypothetical protein